MNRDEAHALVDEIPSFRLMIEHENLLFEL